MRIRCTVNNIERPIRWGILSAGLISSDFAKALAFTENTEVCMYFCLHCYYCFSA